MGANSFLEELNPTEKGGKQTGRLASPESVPFNLTLTLLHSEWPKLYRVLAFLNAIGLKTFGNFSKGEHAHRGLLLNLQRAKSFFYHVSANTLTEA